MKEYLVLNRPSNHFCILLITIFFLFGCSRSDTISEISNFDSPDGSKSIVVKSIIPGSILDSYIEINLFEKSDKNKENILQYAYIYECEKIIMELENNSATIYLNKGSVRFNLSENSEKFEWNISNNLDRFYNKKPNKLVIDNCEKYLDPHEYNRKK